MVSNKTDIRLLITGGAGFVGSNLAILFKRRQPSWHVTAFDNLHRRGSELNLSRLKENDIQFIHGDIRISEDIQSAGNFDLLIECSAEPSVLSGYGGSPAYLYQTNLLGTIHCLEACRRQQAGIVFLSTSRVYPIEKINNLKYIEKETRFDADIKQETEGVSEYGINEDFPLSGVRSLYGASKLCSELMIQEYISAYGIKGVINRCGVISGPWQMGKADQGFVSLWVARHLWGGNLAYIGYEGKGKQVRDVLHIEDLFDLLFLQIQGLHDLNGSVFNVGGGRHMTVSLCELTKFCQEITGRRIPIRSEPENRTADIPYYVSDCRKVESLTGWKPERGIKQIVEDIYLWLCENETLLKSVLE